MSRVAAFDCGTNSLRMLVLETHPGTPSGTHPGTPSGTHPGTPSGTHPGTPSGTHPGTQAKTNRPDQGAPVVRELARTVPVVRELARELRMVRLGAGVDRTGELAPEALARTFGALTEFAKICNDLGVTHKRFVATSATRDAANREDFLAGVRHILGVEPEVVTGLAEAELAFAGATAELAPTTPAPFLVVDIGGGSTEFIGGTDRASTALSLNIGSVRLSERHEFSDPPSSTELAAATRTIDAALYEAQHLFVGPGTVIGVAGSILTVTAAALGLKAYDPGQIHLNRQPIALVQQACTDLITATVAERRLLPYVHPGRVDVIGAGALIWQRVLHRLHEVSSVTEVLVSERDILDGIAHSMQ